MAVWAALHLSTLGLRFLLVWFRAWYLARHGAKMTTEANPDLGKAEDFFQVLIWDNLINVALVAFFAAAPWARFWPLNALIRNVVLIMSGKLYALMKLTVDLEAIAFVNQQNKQLFDRQSVALKAIARGYGIDSPQYKNAREDAKASFAQFIRFNGA